MVRDLAPLGLRFVLGCLAILGILAILGSASATSVGFFGAGCTQQQAKDASAGAKTGVQVTDSACKLVEESVPNLPDWVTLACTVDDVANQVVKVTMPKQAWYAAKAATRDAGPGK